ncbi:heavy-metal-associated domain-containing protein [Natronosporangium hydrolyticum]|uniref:Heavy-metal-associated domain-containing protein n=1 Tax=Natronosporangium hydrolyticum TaxID=2811111 RepID=A0A895Y5S5_9ACTN|nr:heavy-metal-associated domain-containing protein [Natronosporangium hydrolyticum]QSB13064.1 heavy-metal-associated domain-containing protein [Natronosporangium hydrolyticum]
MMSHTYTVKGMTCDHCARSVTEEVSKVAGAVEVTVDLKAGEVTVTSTGPVDDQAVAEAVEEAGYEVVTA